MSEEIVASTRLVVAELRSFVEIAEKELGMNPQAENGSSDPGVGPTKAELREWLLAESKRVLKVAVEAREGGFLERSEYFRGKSVGLNSVIEYLK